MEFIEALDVPIGIDCSINEQESTFLAHSDVRDHDFLGKLSCWNRGGILSLPASIANPLPITAQYNARFLRKAKCQLGFWFFTENSSAKVHSIHNVLESESLNMRTQ
jgi:hypothetical protein